MKRIAMNISINDLEYKLAEMKKEARESEPIIDNNVKWQLNLINKTPEQSDTWELE